MAKVIIEINDLEDDYVKSNISFLDENGNPLSEDTLATPAITIGGYIHYLIANEKLSEIVIKGLKEAGIVFND